MSTKLQKTKQVRILASTHQKVKIYVAENKTTMTKLISKICEEFLNKNYADRSRD